MRGLVVEDESGLAEVIGRRLRREGMAVDLAHDGRDALTKTRIVDYDAVVLDRDLPGVHGDEVCVELVRAERPPRILMLTASGDVGDRISGLNLGADDYLPKPFSPAELVARLRALERRPAVAHPPLLRRHGVELDPARRQVTRDGAAVELGRKEFGVLETLLRADGAVVSAEELLRAVWDENTDPFTGMVRMTIMGLRRKLGDPALIETVTGVGYRIP
jgi:DNA-binding response OmpR family regulator